MRFLFWASAEWERYCLAYNGGPPIDNNGLENIIVPLGPEAEMLARIRPTHRARIRQAQRWMECDVVDKPGIAFENYRQMHKMEVRSKGYEPRPERTYDLMNEWLGTYGLLFLAYQMEQYIGAVYVYVYGEGAYDGSSTRLLGCVDGTGKPWPIHHFLIWSAMKHLASKGYKWLDLGKEHNAGIGSFKRGFIHGEVAELVRQRRLQRTSASAAGVRSTPSPQEAA